MQSSSYELCTPISDSIIKCKQTKVDAYVLNYQAAVELPISSEVCYWSGIKLDGF